MFKIVFYKKPNGDEPAITHLDTLPPRMRAKVLRNMSLLQEKGNLLRYPETDDLGDGIFELRTSFGSDIEGALLLRRASGHCNYTRLHQKDAQNASTRNRASETVQGGLLCTKES